MRAMFDAALSGFRSMWRGCSVLLLVSTQAVIAQQPADFVITGANVITVDDAQQRASAFAIRDGHFIKVGSDEAMPPFTGPQTKVLELAGKTIVPGFIDAHSHPGPVYPEDSPSATVDCRPDVVKDMDGLIAALRRKAEKTAEGEWIVGASYQNLKLGREPTAADLDMASTKHPIIIGHASGHQSVCNTLALQRAKVTAATKDPAGGKFGRNEKGEPNGL